MYKEDKNLCRNKFVTQIYNTYEICVECLKTNTTLRVREILNSPK